MLITMLSFNELTKYRGDKPQATIEIVFEKRSDCTQEQRETFRLTFAPTKPPVIHRREAMFDVNGSEKKNSEKKNL